MPKKGLADSLSAQICSLSEKIVCETCFETMTGGIQADLSPAPAACALSVRETAIASKPLKAASARVAPKFAVKFA